MSLGLLVLFGRACRSFAVGVLTVALPLALEERGVGTAGIDAVLAAGLAGAALQMQGTAVLSRRLGRHRLLALLTFCMAAATAVFAASRSCVAWVAAAFLGGVSMQPNIAAQVPLEKTAIAEVSPRFAKYNMISTISIALGSFATSLHVSGGPNTQVGIVAVVLAICATAYMACAPRVTVGKSEALLEKEHLHISRCRHRVRIYCLAGLFAVDAFAGGLVINSILIHWLSMTFSASEQGLGQLFAMMNLVTTPSLLIAEWLGERIGLVNTMVYTHIPSSMCLILITMASRWELVCALLVLRAATGSMDVPARDSFQMTVVDADERIACASLIDAARGLAAVIGPPVSAVLWRSWSPAAPIVLGGALKIAYDLTLLASFRAVSGPRAAAADAAARGP